MESEEEGDGSGFDGVSDEEEKGLGPENEDEDGSEGAKVHFADAVKSMDWGGFGGDEEDEEISSGSEGEDEDTEGGVDEEYELDEGDEEINEDEGEDDADEGSGLHTTPDPTPTSSSKRNQEEEDLTTTLRKTKEQDKKKGLAVKKQLVSNHPSSHPSKATLIHQI